MKKLDLYLISIIVFMALFTIAMIIIFCIKGFLPDTLIQMAFTYFLGECGVCGIIKAFNTYKETKIQKNSAPTQTLNNKIEPTNTINSNRRRL